MVRLAARRPGRAVVELPAVVDRWNGGTTVRTAGMFVGSPASIDSLVTSLVAAVGSQPSYRFVGPEQYLHAMLVEAGCENLDVAQCHLTTQNPAGTLDRVGIGGVVGVRLDDPVVGRRRRLREEPWTT